MSKSESIRAAATLALVITTTQLRRHRHRQNVSSLGPAPLVYVPGTPREGKLQLRAACNGRKRPSFCLPEGRLAPRSGLEQHYLWAPNARIRLTHGGMCWFADPAWSQLMSRMCAPNRMLIAQLETIAPTHVDAKRRPFMLVEHGFADVPEDGICANDSC